MTLLSDNGVSKVWLDDGWVYKRQPKFMTDNEIWCLEHMYDTGYVPYGERVEVELVRIRYVKKEKLIDPSLFLFHTDLLLKAMHDLGIRHGDLTIYHVLPYKNRPKIIDWGESRALCDPRQDKRIEGDEFWLNKTMQEIVAKNEW
jgi:RIO-like serine/threonine protein kinase